jgi:hypothetical protein
VEQWSTSVSAVINLLAPLKTGKNTAFWDVTLCGSCKNSRFGGTYRFRNVGSYKRHTALTSQKAWFFIVTAVKPQILQGPGRFLVAPQLAPFLHGLSSMELVS